MTSCLLNDVISPPSDGVPLASSFPDGVCSFGFMVLAFLHKCFFLSPTFGAVSVSVCNFILSFGPPAVVVFVCVLCVRV